MKNSGLKNRFTDDVRLAWLDWHACLVCGKNSWDALHHIISPSSRLYVPGDHNRSIYNSCPIHNYPCHIGREGFLFQEETMTDLLEKTRGAVAELSYQQVERDLLFFDIYYNLYR